MKEFFKKLAGFSLGPVIGAVISLITIPMTTYFLSPEEFGKSSMFVMTLAFINIVLYLGMDQSFAREYHDVDEKNVLFFNSMVPPILFSVISFIFLFIFKKNVSNFLFNSDKYGYIAILLGFMLISSVFERFVLMRIRMEEKALEYSLFSIFVKLTVLLSLIFFIIFTERNFLLVVYSTMVGQIIGDIYLVYRYKFFFREFTMKNLDITLIKKMMIFGFPLLIATALNSFLNAMGTLSIRSTSTFYELGIFSAGQRISNFLNIIQLAFTSFWIPTAYRWYKVKREIKNFKLVSDVLLLILTTGYFFLMFFKNYIVILLSSDYEETKFILGFLVLVPILYTLSETTTLGIVFSKKSFLNIWVGLCAVIPCYLLNLVLVPKFGSKGAAISISVAYLIFFTMRSLFSKKNNFSFSLTKHFAVILILFIASITNMIIIENINFYNILLLVMAILVQCSTLKELFYIGEGKSSYELS
ncbi:lipopolysaccharide biosynthesis protein [Vagococcus fluvialis]|uniref:lipopolysaccharide biosynthesis protein n=1 Tax=Vagococcus fluvialis TaxID=2738 RepID=UPI002033BF79|nr:oligosaccharide flippase family protein [Vagococcus fluvialis]MCM2138009.1 oligosaccharide flippase family protein [Vagococcus fluvialis]